ncbi:MAG: transporter [Conexibacter sp.]|nr:transporter [Conexibacter sp.]
MTAHSTTRRPAGVTLAILALSGVAYALLQSLVAPALPEIQRDLHASANSSSWILTSYLLAASIATPLIGRVGDIVGKKRTLVVVLVVLAFGTLISAVASSIGVMLVGRVIQGAGGGIFPLAFAIIRDEFPREKVPASIGTMSALLGIGGGLGIVLAGVIVDNLSYHFLFWLPLIAIAIAAVATVVMVPESPVRAPASINWLAAGLLSIGLAALLYDVSQASTWGWTAPKTVVLFLVAIAALAAWILVELRSRTPLVDMRVMKLRGVWTTNLTAALLGFGMYGSFILVPQFVEMPRSTGYGFGSSVTGAGLCLLPMAAMMLIVGPMAGKLERRFGSKPPVVAGSLITAVAFAMFAFAHGAKLEIYIGSALMGIGIGLAFAAMANIIVAAVPPDQTGVATGINTIARTIGGGFGTTILASILSGQVLVSSGRPAEQGFTIAFATAAGALVLGTLAAWAIPRSGGGARAGARQPAMEPAG